MIAALDAHYSQTRAHAAAVVFHEWRSPDYIAHHTAIESPVLEYEPGRFYLRELSPLLKVIRQIDCHIDTYVIDGYCHLSAKFAPGLGAYLRESLARPATIVGVAKNRYQESQHAVEVFRANSKRPLFVTAIGMGYDVAGQHVKSMAGQCRIPAMLKAVDRLSRTETESR
jgi:deoxyribonuclease V